MNEEGLKESAVLLEDKDKVLKYPADMSSEDIHYHLGVNEYKKPPKDALLEAIATNPIVSKGLDFAVKVMPIQEWERLGKKAQETAMAIPKFAISALEASGKTAALEDTQKEERAISESGKLIGEEIFRSIARVYEPARPAISGLIQKKSVEDIAAGIVRSALEPEQTRSIISETIPMTDWEKEGSAARLIPRAIGETIESVLLYSNALKNVKPLVDNYRITATKNQLNALGENLKVGLIKKGFSEEEAVNILLDPKAQDFIRQTPVFRNITGQGVVKMYSGIPLPEFKPGDIVKIGGEVADILRIEGPNAVLKIAGKEVIKPLAELSTQPVAPITEETKQRGFIKTVKETEKTAPEIKRSISSTYEPIANEETLVKAEDIITSDYNKALEVAYSKDTPDRLSNTIAMRLIDKYQQEGNFVEAKRLIEHTAERNTALGQTIQALAMYRRLSPEGILKYAEGVIKDARESIADKKIFTQLEALQNETERTTFAKKHKIPYLSEQNAEEIYNRAKELRGMAEGREKDIKTALLLDYIARLVLKSIRSKISTLQTMAQLLNPKTIIRNLVGNLGFQGLENLSQVVGTPMDILVSKLTKERTITLPSLKTQAKGALKGFREGAEESLLGIDLKQISSKFDLPKNGVFDNKVLQALEKTMSLTLKATDRAFYTAAFEDSLRVQIKLENADAPTPEMIELAHFDGLYRTFQDRNALSNAFIAIKRALNFGKEWGIGDMVLKYPKTPANILARGIEYSPANFVQSVFLLLKSAMGKEFDQRKFVQQTSRAMVGSVLLLGTGILLAKLGILRGRQDKNRRVKATKKIAGLSDYQLNISALKRFALSGFDIEMAQMQEGDILVTYDWFQPQSINLAMGANMAEEREASSISILADSMLDASQTLVEQPLLQGIRKLSSSNNLIKGALETLQDIPASFMPTLLNQVRQLADNTARNTTDPNYFKEMLNKVVYRVPFLSKGLPEQVDILGMTRQLYQDGTNNPFNVLLNPSFVSVYRPTPVTDMVLDIWLRTGETSQLPRVAPQYIKSEGIKIDLDANRQAQFQQYIGEKTESLFNILAQNASFMRLPDEKKARKLQGYLSDIYNEAKWKVLEVKPKR